MVATVKHNYLIPDFMGSIPEPYREVVRQDFRLESGISGDEESALEILRRVTAVALSGDSYTSALKLEFTTANTGDDISRILMRCHSQGVEGYRRLYRDTVFRRFYDTFLSPACLDWLQGGLPPWPEPEEAIIQSAAQAMNMAGLSRLDSWGTFVLEAYGNSALTFHQFQRLVELPDEQRYEELRRVSATLDTRRDSRFLLTLSQTLKKQHPLLAERLIRQASDGDQVKTDLQYGDAATASGNRGGGSMAKGFRCRIKTLCGKGCTKYISYETSGERNIGYNVRV